MPVSRCEKLANKKATSSVQTFAETDPVTGRYTRIAANDVSQREKIAARSTGTR